MTAHTLVNADDIVRVIFMGDMSHWRNFRLRTRPTTNWDIRLEAHFESVDTVRRNRKEYTVTTLSDHIRHEHREIEPHVDSILTTAHAVGVVPRQVLVDLVTGVMDFLRHELLPHALKEDEAIYQAVEKAIGAKGSTDTMKREHEGIKSYVDELTDLQGVLMSRSEIHEDTVRELRRVLYGIHALVEMHLTVEEDVYLPLLDTLPSEAQQHYIDEVERVLED